MSTLFVSDLHLEAERPDIGQQFIEFLKTDAMEADDLYILGDLFEAWVGDDDPNSHYAKIKLAIRKVVDKDVALLREMLLEKQVRLELSDAARRAAYVLEVIEAQPVLVLLREHRDEVRRRRAARIDVDVAQRVAPASTVLRADVQVA